ncbi:MAG: lysophospholipid acyltransferase family protein [Actinomycetota bacterium]|jgi:1-acyl-sn-glycerol-3-phosphate acyltransferase
MSVSTAARVDTRKTLGYRAFHTLLHIIWIALFRPRVIGREKIPETGPILLAPIHRSNIDFAFILFLTKRKTFFMGKDSLFRIPILGSLCTAMGAFPVKRGTADRESLETAQRILEAGEGLVLFPEGTRKEGMAVETLQNGAMFLASRTGALVIPVGIGNTQRAMPKGAIFPRPVRVTIVIGDPIAVPMVDGRASRAAIAESTEHLRASLESVYRQSMNADN